MTRLAVTLAALLIALPAGAATVPTQAIASDAWRLGPAPSDNPELMAASVSNDEGHTIYFWTLVGDTAHQVFCELHLAEGQRFGAAMPVYRIDDRAAVDTGAIREAGEARNALWGHVGESAAFWLISTLPVQDAVVDAALAPWLDGREVVVTYRGADGAEQTTRFTLAGSDAAIRNAIGLQAR